MEREEALRRWTTLPVQTRERMAALDLVDRQWPQGAKEAAREFLAANDVPAPEASSAPVAASAAAPAPEADAARAAAPTPSTAPTADEELREKERQLREEVERLERMLQTKS